MSRIADALQRAGVATPEGAPVVTLESFAGAGESSTANPAAASKPAPGASRPSAGAAAASTPASPAVLGSPKPSPVALTVCAQDERLIASPEADRVAAEQYRKLASTLHQLQVERKVRTVLVTSAVTGEGKTLTAANLALMLSESFRRRVLLIDADLRRPMLDTLFGVHAPKGLSSVLRAAAEPIAPVIGVTERLALLAGGRPDPDPVSGLTSDRMRHLLEDAAEVFDWVIVDSAPVGLVPDGALLSMLVDGVVLVVRASSTSSGALQRAVAAITPERIIGAVLNRAEKVTLAQYGYYRGSPDDTYLGSATDAPARSNGNDKS